MKEDWKPLIYGDLDLSNRFEISNFGRLKSIKSNNILKTRIDANGYEVICISLGQRDKKKILKIHRCVAFMYVNGYKEGLTVNHIDGNKTNNICTNLEWITNRENIKHAINNGLVKYNKRIQCEQTGEIFNSIADASEWCGLSRNGYSIYEYLKKSTRKSAGRHPVTKEKLTWHLV
ncbi:MAG: HNH endonuclease [Psychrobacillus sp.]